MGIKYIGSIIELLMNNQVRNRILLLVITIATVVTLLFCCSCSSDYNKFSEGLDFTFEYPSGEWPDGWLVTPVLEYPTLIEAGLLGPSPETTIYASAVNVRLITWIKPQLDVEAEAQEKISDDIVAYSNTPNFQIIRREDIKIDDVKGFLVEYSYDYDMSLDSANNEGVFFPSRVLNIAIPWNMKVYQIRISATQNEWAKHEKDIEHILDTFRWK